MTRKVRGDFGRTAGGSMTPGRQQFFCIALQECGLVRLTQAIEVSPGLTVTPRVPEWIRLSEAWRSTFGSHFASRFETANLAIVARSADVDLTSTQYDAYCLLYALFLHGHPSYSHSAYVQAREPWDGDRLSNVGEMTRTHRHPHTLLPVIDEQTVSSATPVANRLRAARPEQGVSPLSRGFNAWLDGIRARSLGARVHQFVRSIEAFTRHRNESEFVDRLARLIVIPGGGDIPQTLREMYQLRSKEEHLRALSTALPSKNKKQHKEVISLRAWQSEQIACWMFLTVLRSADLQAVFSNDEDANSFWKGVPQTPESRWPGRFDLSLPVASHVYEED